MATYHNLINNSIKRFFQFLQEMTDEALNINNQNLFLVKSLLIMSVVNKTQDHFIFL